MVTSSFKGFGNDLLKAIGFSTFIFSLSLSIALPAPEARAADVGSVLGDVWGIATDPLKLGKASSNLLEAVNRLNIMLGQLQQLASSVNQDIKDRVDQVQAIVNQVISAVDRNVATVGQIISQAEKDVAALEDKIYKDAQKLLAQVTCVVEQAANDQAQRAIKSALNEFLEAHIGVKIAGITLGGITGKEIQIDDPDQAYSSTRDHYLAALNQLQDGDPAWSIVSAYGNIVRFARFAECSYRGIPAVYDALLREELTYQNLANAWTPLQPSVAAAIHK